VTSMPAFGLLLFVIFGVLGLVSVKRGRSALPGGDRSNAIFKIQCRTHMEKRLAA
jgi:hypothetical protein